jgi:hypothetical protein
MDNEKLIFCINWFWWYGDWNGLKIWNLSWCKFIKRVFCCNLNFWKYWTFKPKLRLYNLKHLSLGTLKYLLLISSNFYLYLFKTNIFNSNSFPILFIYYQEKIFYFVKHHTYRYRLLWDLCIQELWSWQIWINIWFNWEYSVHISLFPI